MNKAYQQLSQVADCLLVIEMEMRRLELWSEQWPGDDALASSQPFCVDTLSFDQWLQFVFIERMKVLVEGGHPLPTVSGIAPMAEEYFRGRAAGGQTLVRHLAEMDRLLGEA